MTKWNPVGGGQQRRFPACCSKFQASQIERWRGSGAGSEGREGLGVGSDEQERLRYAGRKRIGEATQGVRKISAERATIGYEAPEG